MTPELINFFNVALVEDELVDAYEVNSLAIRCGYIIHPSICNKSTLNFAKSLQANYNSTFYQCWEQVTNSSTSALFVDRMMHYASTYGTNFESEPFVINENPLEIPYKQYTVILPISEQELQCKCLNVIQSGIALHNDTVYELVEFLAESQAEVDINSIKNKEAQAMLAAKLNVYPADNFSILRCLVFNATNSSMLIKDEETIRGISYGNEVDMSVLSKDQLIELSKIFRRFKPIFLAFKNNNEVNKPIINKIRRLSDTYHQPFFAGFWETVLAAPYYNTIKEVRERLHEINNFKIIQLIQSCQEKLLSTSYPAPKMYKIRNNKVWMKEQEYPLLDNKSYYWEEMISVLYNELVKRLKEKACTVKFPEHLQLTCPSSEKNFMGNIPYGSYFEMQDKNYIGIYWRNEWGTHDFDLSAVDANNRKVGWNAEYYSYHPDKTKNDWGLIYSGDMTSAEPEATEYLSCNKNCENSIIYVNRYSGSKNSKFRLLYGWDDDLKKAPESNWRAPHQKPYMVDPNSLHVKEDIISESAQQMIGCIVNNKMYLMNLRLGEQRVSGAKMNQYILPILERKSKCYLSLKTLLLKAGFKERKRDTKENPIQLDLTNLDKGTLIELFS